MRDPVVTETRYRSAFTKLTKLDCSAGIKRFEKTGGKRLPAVRIKPRVRHSARKQFPVWFAPLPDAFKMFPDSEKSETWDKPLQRRDSPSGKVRRPVRKPRVGQPGSPRFGEYFSDRPEMPANCGLSLLYQSL